MKEKNAGNTTMRNSRIELLRLICIFFVILRHYVTQARFPVFTSDNFTWQVSFLQIMTVGGFVANNIFLLITGYHMIDSKVNLKKILKLIVEMHFYSWIILAFILGKDILSVSFKDIIRAIFPLWFGYNWYLSCYVILCCFLPFLNPFLNSLSKDRFRKLLIVVMGIWSVAYTFLARTYMEPDFSVDHFIIIYSLGAYIRRFGISLKRGSWKSLFFIFSFVLVGSVIAIGVLGHMAGNDEIVAGATYFSSSANIVNVIIALSAFLWVLESEAFHNRYINISSRSVVGIYMIHHNPLLKKYIWDILYPNVEYFYSPLLPIHCFLKVMAVFLVCLFIDQLRFITVDRVLSSIIDRYYDRFTAVFERCVQKLKSLSPFRE